MPVLCQILRGGEVGKTIGPPEKHSKALNLHSRQRKVSRAALVREAGSACIDISSKTARKAALDAALGICKDQPIDGLEYQKKIPDALILATAKIEHALLITRDTHFRGKTPSLRFPCKL